MNEALCALKLIYTCKPVDAENGMQIGAFRRDLGADLADKIMPYIKDAGIDYVVPVPNSGLYYAMGFAERSRIPYLQPLVKKDDAVRSLGESDLTARARQIKENIVCILPDIIRDKHVLLIDEAIFTGITLKSMCEYLKHIGVSKISIAIPTSRVINTCPHMPQRQILARTMDTEEMKEYFGAENLFYQDETGFFKETERFGQVCLTCFKEG